MATCDSCGKNVQAPPGHGSTGSIMNVKMRVEPTDPPEYANFVRAQLGPYEANHEYHICTECCLKAFGVKPPEAPSAPV